MPELRSPLLSQNKILTGEENTIEYSYASIICTNGYINTYYISSTLFAFFKEKNYCSVIELIHLIGIFSGWGWCAILGRVILKFQKNVYLIIEGIVKPLVHKNFIALIFHF